MKAALYYHNTGNSKVECALCPHNCKIKDQNRGLCGVRKNIGGKLFAENYELVTALGFDPIEKKPLYHFFPGREILSIGSIGCNLKCFFCQNWEISQATPDDIPSKHSYSVDKVVQLAVKQKDNLGVAYTYNEPVIYYEYMRDIARKIKQEGMKNVVVTNGFINPEPLEDLIPYIDACSVDLKGFTDEFYKKYTGSRFQPIKNTLEKLGDSNLLLEIINLVIPTLNDDMGKFEQMLKWIRDHVGENTVLHISRYHPGYKSSIPATPASTLKSFYALATQYLNYVYLGNILLEEGSNTYCHQCQNLLVRRAGYSAETPGLDADGSCLFCGNKVFIR